MIIGGVGAIVITAAGSGYIGWRLGASRQEELSEVRTLRSKSTQFQFINPLIGLDDSEKKEIQELKDLKNEISDFIASYTQEGKIEALSVYFRDPLTGHWLGINEDASFLPGSLIKVPVMTAYFKKAEKNQEILSQKIYYGGNSSDQPLVPHPLVSSLARNKSYTVEELIAAMIQDSDNEALGLLLDNIDPEYLHEVFGDLGVTFPGTYTYTITPRSYSLFFRVLFNSTYLNRDYSEKALKLLTETTFDDGIVAGTGNNIVIAHKYGERGEYEDIRVVGVELSDCGIVYYPSHPYFLCIVAKGTNTDDLKFVIQKISSLVIQDIRQNY